LKVGKSIVLNGEMGMRKFWSVALPFGKVAFAVKVWDRGFKTSFKELNSFPNSL
jgi:hypothetical protein